MDAVKHKYGEKGAPILSHGFLCIKHGKLLLSIVSEVHNCSEILSFLSSLCEQKQEKKQDDAYSTFKKINK